MLNNFLSPKTKSGFTLIEISIVLVIIGLIVGGILTGRDLINAAAIRSQLSQLDKYNAAAKLFDTKYGGLPGDLPNPYASQYGFIARGSLPGEGDGNGIIEGPAPGTHCVSHTTEGYGNSYGEQTTFWEDLSQVGLIEGSFTSASETDSTIQLVNQSWGTALTATYPNARIGGGNYVTVISGGPGWCDMSIAHNAINYFSLSVISLVNMNGTTSTPGLTVMQAQAMDSKIDDGLPLSGTVTAFFSNYSLGDNSLVGAAAGTATPGSSTTCYDNGNNSSATMAYSTRQNGGNGINCVLAFQFQ